MTRNDYIAFVPQVPEWALTAAEGLTVVVFVWVIYEVIRLVLFFRHDRSPLAKRLTNEFATKGLLAFLTILMGMTLYFNFAYGVKMLVLFRPALGILSALALRKLYQHYKSM